MKLLPHQDAAARWLAERPRAVLADDPGLGKTAAAIMAAQRIGAVRIVVLCPACVLWNWKAEVEAWAPGLRVQVLDHGTARPSPDADVYVTTHGLLLSALAGKLAALRPDVLIVDEIHFFRAWSAKRTRALHELAPHARFAWGLSGTLLPNSAADLWPTAHHFWPDRFPERFFGYRNRFCETAWSPYGDHVKVIGNRNVDELRERLRGVVLRRRRDDVLDLPPVTWETVATVPAHPPTEFASIASEVEDLLDSPVPVALAAQYPGAATVADMLAADADPEDVFRALGASQALAKWRRICATVKAELAVDLLANDLDGGVDRIVVMAHHRDVVDTIAAGLSKYGVATVTGGTSARDRAEAVAAFQRTDVRVIACNILAGGTGITLTAARELLFVELSYVPGENAQAADRIRRIGQKRPCRVRFLSLAGTPDEGIVATLARKVRMIAEVLDEKKEPARLTDDTGSV